MNRSSYTMAHPNSVRQIFNRIYIWAAAALVPATAAQANYIGPAYLEVPGVNGTAVHGAYRGWFRTEAHYWTLKPGRNPIRGISGKESGLKFTGPRTPAKGPSFLGLAISKTDPSLPGLMTLCQSGQIVPQLVFAESSDLARHPQEHGPRPEDVPDFYEYVLKNVKLTCPVVAGAPEQAIGVQFEAIDWRNFQPQPQPRPLTTTPAKLEPGARSGETRTFIISWFAPISDAAENQCPTMNRKPTQDEYYALMSPERAAQQRAALAKSGGANTVVLPYRGPDEMNVILLPGIVSDPGHVMPVANRVRGFDLDGWDGQGKPPATTSMHHNFTSPDGRTGIDNQFFEVFGCVEGWRRSGFLPMIGNELRRAGGLSILVEVSGLDDRLNDNDVTVSLLYSADPIRRDGTSKIVLPDFTFRVNSNPEFSQDFARFRGRMVNGVIMTDVEPLVTLHEGPASTWSLHEARMRLEFTGNGGLSATLGGYRDWRELLAMSFFQASDYENTIGFNAPSIYNAVRRAADGLLDPETGLFNGISAAYEMEGIPAFIPGDQHDILTRGGRYPVSASR